MINQLWKEKKTIQICITLEQSAKHEIWVSDALRGEISRTRGEYVRLDVHIPLSLSQRLSLFLSCIEQAWWILICHPRYLLLTLQFHTQANAVVLHRCRNSAKPQDDLDSCWYWAVYHRITNQIFQSNCKHTGKTCIHQMGKFILMTMFRESLSVQSLKAILIEILLYVCLFITHYINFENLFIDLKKKIGLL